MSAVMGSYGHEMDASYAADFSRDREPMKKRSRHPEYRRKGSAPTRVSGMHCRRNKRWTWGSGRGARMTNIRAFAGAAAIAMALAGALAQAAPLTLDFATVGNPGNAGRVLASGTYGAVANPFLLSKFETTNAQYAQFLNAVGATGTNGVWVSAMNSDANGGISRSGAVGSYTYALKAGTNPEGVAWGDAPVNFTTWFSAARYVNWLAGGMQSGTAGIASMEGGFSGSAYNLAGKTSGTIVSRNSNAKYFLPSIDEFYKASFYNGSGYNTWATSSSASTPGIANTIASATNTNVATYGASGAGVTGPLAVDAFTNSLSPYGLYGMLGNISEMTDTANGSGNAGVLSGSWGTTTAQVTNFNSTFGGLGAPQYILGTTSTAQIGFRVGQIAPVPEPETITLAAFGLIGLCGARWMRRRKTVSAPVAA